VSRSETADTPLPVLGKKCRQHGLLGTPVEGLTGMPVSMQTHKHSPTHRWSTKAWELTLPLACAG
jgi:hypothetical protein